MRYVTIGCLILVYITRFSLGDELGFGESLGNLEGNKRRSLNDRVSAANVNSLGVLPASKLPPTQLTPVQQNRPHALTVRPPQSAMMTTRPPINAYKSVNTVKMTEAVSLPLGVPAFRPIPKTVEKAVNTNVVVQQPQSTFNRKVMLQSTSNVQQMNQIQNYTFLQPAAVQQSSVVQKISKTSTYEVPAFQAMPSSVSRISTGQIVQIDNQNSYQPTMNVKREDTQMNQLDQLQKQSKTILPQVDLMGHTVEELAAVANVSVAAIQKAIALKQQKLLADQQAAMYQQQINMIKQYEATSVSTTASRTAPTRPPTRPTTTTTPPPRTTPKYVISGGSKVMNAPKEYYPVGYDKNFDDNFMSKVDLPATSFHCGDQKHFPGLYADMDLGCMVFHVCALTDDGLIMKSFLCPESTLFDQTILKCNWWFYVDCKGSKNLYDSNLPVSKSYQLMKALTFFSNYKNSQNEKDGVDVEALKNSVSSSKTSV